MEEKRRLSEHVCGLFGCYVRRGGHDGLEEKLLTECR